MNLSVNTTESVPQSMDYKHWYMYMAIGSLGLLGNSLVIVVIFKYTTMRRSLTNLLIINQSTIDMVTSAILLTSYASRYENNNIIPSGTVGEIICRLWTSNCLLWGFFTSSTYNLVALSLERYAKVVHPIWYQQAFTRWRAYMLLVTIWLVGIIYNIVTIVPTSGVVDGMCFPLAFFPSVKVQKFVGIVTIIAQFIFPLLILIFSYVNMVRILGRRVRPADVPCYSIEANSTVIRESHISQSEQKCIATYRDVINNHDKTRVTNVAHGKSVNVHKEVLPPISNDQPNITARPTSVPVSLPEEATNNQTKPCNTVPSSSESQPNRGLRRILRAKHNVVKTLAVVIICFIFCWIWNEVFFLLFNLGGKVSFSSRFYKFSLIAVYLNCCLNPFIYAFKYREFQKGLKKLFCSRKQIVC